MAEADKKSTFTLPRQRHFFGKKETMSIRLPDDLKAELLLVATESGQGLSDVIQDALDDFVMYCRSEKKTRKGGPNARS